MKSKDYEYAVASEDYELSEERKQQLISRVKQQIIKGFIAHYQILSIGKNDNEYDFIYDWLDENDIEIRGINGTISGEIENYKHIPKMTQSIVPEPQNENEQMKLFTKLNEFSKKDKVANIKEYQDVRNKLIESNMKLAKWVANWNGIRKIQLPIEDKQQMAMLGLISAVDKFDPDLGYKFSTYACKAIYRRIVRESYKHAEIKYSIMMHEQLSMIPDIENHMLMNMGRKPENYEIADILGISLKRVGQLQEVRRMIDIKSLDEKEESEHNIENILSHLSDGDKVKHDTYQYIVDGIYIDEEVVPQGFRTTDMVSDKAMSELLKLEIEKCLGKLKEREQNVLRLRFGLDGKGAKTLETVGRYLNCTSERIRQIEAKALRKIRYSSDCRKLEDYYEEK